MKFRDIKKYLAIPEYFSGIALFLIAISISLSGCASKTLKIVKGNEIELKLMEKRINLAEKKLEKLYNRLSIIQFMVDNHEQTLKSLTPSKAIPYEEKVTKQKQVVSPEALYSNGIREIKAGNYDSAINIFKNFMTKYPTNNLTDNALYWTGEAYYSKKEFNKSAKIFSSLPEKYPDGNKAPDALLKAGFSYLKLKNKKKAKKMFQKVLKLYPFSNAAPKAETKLKLLL